MSYVRIERSNFDNWYAIIVDGSLVDNAASLKEAEAQVKLIQARDKHVRRLQDGSVGENSSSKGTRSGFC